MLTEYKEKLDQTTKTKTKPTKQEKEELQEKPKHRQQKEKTTYTPPRDTHRKLELENNHQNKSCTTKKTNSKRREIKNYTTLRLKQTKEEERKPLTNEIQHQWNLTTIQL